MLRNDDRAFRHTLDLVQNDGFAFMLVGPKHLINKIGCRLRPALLDLKLQDALGALERSDLKLGAD